MEEGKGKRQELKDGWDCCEMVSSTNHVVLALMSTWYNDSFHKTCKRLSHH